MEHTLGVHNRGDNSWLCRAVLILVLVEHTLGDPQFNPMANPKLVLILVLVEHTLGVPKFSFSLSYEVVLILVLVEHTLGERAHEVRSQ